MNTNTAQPLVCINAVEITPIVVREQRVLTLAQIDKVHGRPEGTAKRNFTENKSRLIEGKEYFVVSPDEIRTTNPGAISSAHRSSLTVVTETGYLLLVKSFTDDLAWQVQRELVNAYFRAGSPNVIGERVDTLEPSEQQTLMEIVKAKVSHLPSEQQGKGIAEVWSRVHHKFRVAKYSQLPRTELSAAILYVTSMELRTVPNPPRLPELCTQEQRSYLSRRTAYAGEHAHMAKALAWAISDRVRREMGVASMRDLPASSFQAAADLIENLGSKAFMLKSRVIDIEKRFCLLVIRDGSASSLAEFEALFSEELQAMLTAFAAPDALPMPSRQKALPI